MIDRDHNLVKINSGNHRFAISRILKRGHKISSIDIGDLYWHDVDYPNDLNNAKLNIDRISSNKKTNLRVV